MTPVLTPDFFARSALEVAPDLIGCRLVCETEGLRVSGRIVETEAYLGQEDAASHAFRGPTPRSQLMFGPAGRAYVYLIYGVHHCLNVVTGAEGEGQAVLIRAVEPVTGVGIMQQRRGRQAVWELANGPGKLCQAFAIDRSFNGHDLLSGSTLWLQPRHSPPPNILFGPRIGVRGDEQALTAPRRFWEQDNPHVSR